MSESNISVYPQHHLRLFQVEASQALREIYLCCLSEDLQGLLERAWQVKGQEKAEEKKAAKTSVGKKMMGSFMGSSFLGDEDEMEDDLEESEGVEVDISIEGQTLFLVLPQSKFSTCIINH